jgi:hypothetical protein
MGTTEVLLPRRAATTKSHYASVRGHPASEKSNLSENTCWLVPSPGSKTTLLCPSSRVSCFGTGYRLDRSARSRVFGRCPCQGLDGVLWARPHDHHQLCRVRSSCAQILSPKQMVVGGCLGLVAVVWAFRVHDWQCPGGW